jgi:tetratricopeptide (TPR) repeat protein
VSGFNLAEAFYLSTPFLSWRNMVIGDPLCAPFQSAPLAAAEIAKDLDAATELPALFAERRVAVLAKTGFKKEALQLYLKANARVAKGDKEIAEKLLAQLLRLEPTFQLARLQYATMLEERSNFDSAMAEYEKILEVDPKQVIALNNLAYALAVRKNEPETALGFAERAFSLAPTAAIADTLGWIHYLLGNTTLAAPLLARAAVAMPESAEVQLHAAFALAAVDSTAKAREALAAALKLNPAFAERADVKDLQKKIEGKH